MEHSKLLNREAYIIKIIDASSTWQLRHKVMWAEKPISFVKLPNDEEGLHYGLFIENQLVSVISLFIEQSGKCAQFRKFCTDQNFQNRGLGSFLIKHLINEAEKLHVEKLWCDARIAAIEFYEKFGMRVEGKSFLKNGKEYVKMAIEL